MEKIITKIKCPNCDGDSKLWGSKNSYDMYSCIECKLIFVHPIPTPENVYNEDYFSGATEGHGYVDYDNDKEPMIPTFNHYLDLCAKYGKSGGNVFDIGAATGFFLGIAKRRGFNVKGVELSNYAASIGREKGLDVVTGDLLSLNLPSDFFDIVTMFDVVEHFTDPFKELREVKRILKKGGLLVINTPNGESFLSKILKTHWHIVVPPEHLFYFSPSNISLFLKKEGFSVKYSGSIGKRFTLKYIFKTLHRWQGLSVWKYLANFFGKDSRSSLYIPLNLYDNFFMILEKD